MGRHQYLNEDEYEVNLKDFEPQPGELLDNLTVVLCWSAEVALPVVLMGLSSAQKAGFVWTWDAFYIITEQVFVSTCVHTYRC